MNSNPNPLFASLVTQLLGGFGVAARRLALVLVSMAMEHHWLPGDMADIAAKVLVFVAFAALEWLLFVYRTRSGRHIQDIINDYAGTDIIRRDGFVGPETVNAARKLLPPRDL